MFYIYLAIATVMELHIFSALNKYTPSNTPLLGSAPVRMHDSCCVTENELIGPAAARERELLSSSI